ncbi:hypothetical protein CROQUDRAFT_46199 [Cronartium quercuum f. sp. fusiforme G11]|uniref:Uncharacterized protein n=1 Tax=Cronartium quercuum f. sp. fusiforme G11 TaxID=708437 RepID=A0A9P6NKF7_9BASI|nr:hypothetical protein CROQUDRAFT_46199 [Cronartium quercuum f. sp. fusiforme G11]
MDFLGRRWARQPSNSSTQTNAPHAQQQQTPGRAPRHSLAPSLLVPRPSGRRSIFGNAEPNRPPAYRELPPRSISASYAPSARPPAGTGIPRSSTTYGRGRSLAQMAASPEKPKGRMERIKGQIKSRFDFSAYTDYPSDKWMEIQEQLEMIDFGEMGYSFGIGLIGVHLTIKLTIAIERARRNLVNSRRSTFSSSALAAGDRLSEARALAKSRFSISWLDILSLLSILLIVFSCWNAYKLFRSRRSYRMQIREVRSLSDFVCFHDPVNSPNASLVQSPTAPEAAAQTWGQASWKMIKRISNLLTGYPRPGADDVPKPSQIYQLDVWDPSDLRLKIFTLYSPANALLLHFGNFSENAIYCTLMMVVINFHSHVLIKSFTQQVKDKNIVQSEVMNEYNTKFVYPTAFPHRRSIGTMTSSAEFIRRQDWMEY